MSRIGKRIIEIPQGVTVEVKDGLIVVKGPKGELKRVLNPLVTIIINNNEISVDVKNKENKKERSLWGTYGSHIKNMIIGVTDGFKKELEVNGVGYKIAMEGKDLKLEVGFSHSVLYNVPEGITVSVEKNLIKIEGADIELVGKVASEIRSVRKPEPYKGKGIKYVDEIIRRKAGKTAGDK
ncbi:50S ribosomal protein L6 [Patescibacteria group bacterium]|nr:50S ribosomal protein L6 [Patescibacteria group bacterium]MBU1895789.1 50S ribosomal protein L6 [Patescibacteria group bacterium]